MEAAVKAIMDDANAQIRAFNARKDYRTAGIAKAAEALTEDSVEDDKRERLMRLMDGVMNAPNYVTEQQLRELHIKVRGTNEAKAEG